MTVTAAELAAIIAGIRPAATGDQAGMEWAEATFTDQIDREPNKPARAATAVCRVCGEHLDASLAAAGLHLLCKEPEPPSTVAELRDVLIGYDASRPRTMQVRLGPSELGTPCQQQIARKLAAAPRRPVDAPMWAPFQGTAVHAEMEHVVAHWNTALGRQRWLAEDSLTIDEEIRGHGDAYDLDTHMVVDWKHTGTTALKKLGQAKRAGRPPAAQVSQEYRVQAHLYGLGHERKGRPVRWVRLVLLARSWQFDDSDEWTEQYDPEIAFKAMDRYYATKELLAALDVAANPEMVTAVPVTPSSDACKWCPFHRPGKPTDWAGCAGDEGAYAKTIDRFTDGLIIPKDPGT